MFDRLLSAFSSPSLPKLAKAVTGRLAARGATDIVYDEALKEIRATSNGATCAISLVNLWPQYRGAAASDRWAVLERFVSGVFPGAANELPVDYASARSRILPIVRQAADDALAQLMSQRLMTKGDDVESLGSASQVLLDDKVVGVAFDAPDALTRLTRKQLRGWGVSLDAVLSDALHNLRGLPEHAGWQQVAPGLWSGQWGDSYESSRVLLPDLIYRVGITDPVALVPLRDCLLIASVKDESALLAMVNHARERMACCLTKECYPGSGCRFIAGFEVLFIGGRGLWSCGRRVRRWATQGAQRRVVHGRARCAKGASSTCPQPSGRAAPGPRGSTFFAPPALTFRLIQLRPCASDPRSALSRARSATP